MSRTMWLALFCMIGLGPVIAIKLATPASLVVEPAQDQSKIEPAIAANESAKGDRLELFNTPAKTEIVAPATKAMPAESPSTSPDTINPSENPSPLRRLRAGIGGTPTLRLCRPHRLLGILRAKNRREALAKNPRK